MLEHDWEDRIVDGTTDIIANRISHRFHWSMPKEIPPLISRDQLKVNFLTPPHGRPMQKATATGLFAVCDINRQTVDSFVAVEVSSSLEVDGGGGAAAAAAAAACTAVFEDERQWFPASQCAWQYLLKNFDRTEITGDSENPVFALSFKHPVGADYLPEDQAIGVAADFFHFFLGLLVEGSLEDCIENGRYAYQIRKASLAGPALCIDNGHVRPGFEGMDRVFDRLAAINLSGKGIFPHFVMRNPTRSSYTIKAPQEYCQAIFGASAQFTLLAGDPISLNFEVVPDMILQERQVKHQPPLPLFMSLLMIFLPLSIIRYRR